jgi:DNA-binding GntR family transcriptional regulator
MTLAERIERDLTRLLAEREPLPFKLSLSGIARHFNVSPMPVRIAVQALVDAGIMDKDEAGRLSVNEDALPAADALPDDEAQAEASSIHDQLVSEIVRRGLTHDEHYLREAATAKQYGVGRTVVRRVFSELAGRGLLVHVPRCGWQVRPYREQDTIDYLVVRELLERRAVEMAFGKMDASVLKEIYDGNQPSSNGQPAQLDNRMHAYWIGLCGNRYIQHFFEHEGAYYETIFDHAGLDPASVDRMVAQHRAVLGALIDKDLPRALDALSNHILGQRANVSSMIGRLQEQ